MIATTKYFYLRIYLEFQTYSPYYYQLPLMLPLMLIIKDYQALYRLACYVKACQEY